MALVVLSLGTNKGERLNNLRKAIDLINSIIGHVGKRSSVYETEPWGFESEQWFLNAAITVSTELHPLELLKHTQQIEQILGREKKSVPGHGYQSRVIDIDIIFYDDRIVKTAELSIPHPLMHDRKFVLNPLVEIVPEKNHPLLNMSVRELFLHSKDTTEVKFYDHPSALESVVYKDFDLKT